MGQASQRHVDVAILGGGSAGYAAARTTAAGGLKTAVIDGGPELGGLCILRGCMPTKALLYASEVKHLAEKGSTWGLQIPKVSFDFQKVMARKAAMVEEFASYRREQLQDGRFELIRSKARFRDSHTLLLEDGSLVQADSILLATGSSVAPLPLPSLESIQPWTSNDVLDLKRLPASIIVLGGGPVALELAQFFLRFGVKTTLIQRSKQLLSGFDEDVASPLQQALEEEGMQIYTHTRLLSASRKGGMDCITFEHEGKTREVYAEAVLHGLGRVPNLGGLNLEKAGLNLQQGRLKTDAQMRSRVSHIYAAGDCAGPHEIVHIAIQQGETAAHNILHPKSPRTMDYRALVSVVFTDPQVAMVGLSEAEAKRSGRRVLCADYPFNDHGKSMLMEAMHGKVKLIADATSGEILGGACTGPMAGDLIHEIVVAVHQRMRAQELAVVPHYHPTLAEIWTYPAEDIADALS